MAIKLSALVILLVCTASCTYRGASYSGQGFIITDRIDNIAILPFNYVGGAGKPDIPDEFINNFNNELYNRLTAGLGGVNVVSIGKSYDALKSIRIRPDSIEFIPEFCLKTGCDAVLTGEIKDFGERVGGEYGVEYPASFAFITKLHEGRTGTVIWEDYYYEKQKPLSDNVVEVDKFIKRRGRWVSTEEIAYEGIDQLVSRLSIALK